MKSFICFVLLMTLAYGAKSQCMITCQGDISVNANTGSCEAFVTIPIPDITGTCTPAPVDQSGIYPVGTTEVIFEAGQGVDYQTCSIFVTVLDNEDPVFGNCNNVVVNLAQGECEANVIHDFAPSDNCTNPSFAFTQSEDLNTLNENQLDFENCANHFYRVFDLPAMNQHTDVNVSSVNVGVYESFNNPNVVVNIYSLEGDILSGTLELVGSGSAILPDLSENLYNIPVAATVESTQKMVVEIITPPSILGGNIMAFNTIGQSGNSYYSSPDCGVSNLNISSDHLVMSVQGNMEAFKLTQTDDSGYSSGDAFPAGVTQQEYVLTDAIGNSATCNFSVTINTFLNTVTSMTCNNFVQVTLDENCEAYIGADQILEGDSYSCYTDYTIHITNEQGLDIGNHLTSAHVGQTLKVTVESPDENSCWGEILVEDKVGPVLECVDIYTTCAGSTDPGADVAEDLAFSSAGLYEWLDDSPSTVEIIIPVNGLDNAVIEDVNVYLDIEHSDVSNLRAVIESPEGTVVPLFNYPTSQNLDLACTHDNIKIKLDDDATNTHVDLLNLCSTEAYALDDSFIPLSSLSTINNENPQGEWKIRITDINNEDGGQLIDARIEIRQSGAEVSLPIPADATYVKSGNFNFRVDGLDPCGYADLLYNDEILDQDCSSPYSEIILRSWSATDESGNIATPCVQTIYVYRSDASTIVWPINYDGIEEAYLSCVDWKDEVPGPEVTGYPTPLSGELCDNIQIFPHEDTRIDICESSYKILRYWKIIEWCSGDILEYTQIIKVLDDEIILVCPQDEIEATEGTFSCSGFATLPIPTVENECSDWDYEVKWFVNEDDIIATSEGVTYNENTNEYSIAGLREGINIVQYIATDACGNQDICAVEILVEDNIAPSAVCDEFTVVAIAANGESYVHASTFDNGSTDNCEIVYMDARKMTNTCTQGSTNWAEELVFCCSEIGTTVMVEFRVYDAADNWNSCMVEVQVQDKLPPYITYCPENIEISCKLDWKDLTITGEPEYVDNCGVESVEFTDDVDIDNCGVGTIERLWTVTDGVGLKHSCTQYIEVVDLDPFKASDVTWPKDYSTHGCEDGLTPDELPVAYAYPRFKKEDACNLVAATYKDQVFNIVDGSCVKILRTWTVIDWCTYNDLEAHDPYSTGIWVDVQVLKLTNQEAPVFESCDDLDVCAYDLCTDIPEVTLKQSATDDCTLEEDLYWTYEIDVNNDGIIDYSGNSNSVTEDIPYGEHKIIWVVGDKCGNTTRCEQEFKVIDCKNPTPYCLSTVVTTVMNNNGSVEIWASDFDLGSYDNCTEQENLVISFSESTALSAQSITLTCADIPDGESELIPLEIWVIDEAGNKDFCEITLFVQDNESNICDPIETVTIQGDLMTENDEMLSDVMVTYVSHDSEKTNEMMTTSNGHYSFDVPMSYNYNISNVKNDNPMNGVSTLDLLLIQRHILKIKEFDSPYKIIAADVDNNHKINAGDLLDLRKLILGKIQAFEGEQKSWRFVNNNFVFTNPKVPFPFAESIEIDELESSMDNLSFTGVKIGDVNGNVAINAQLNNDNINRDNDLNLYSPISNFEENNSVEIPVTMSEFTKLSGAQFTIQFDPSTLNFDTYKSGVLELNDSNFGFESLDRSNITFSWSDIEALKVDADDVLFTLIFNATANGSTNEVFSINSDLTNAEAYDEQLNTKNIKYSALVDHSMEEFVLYQNTPNPFNATTTISFYLPESSQVKLSIYDLSGRLINVSEGSYNNGLNSIDLDLTDNNVSGILYYQLDTDSFTATRKMIIIE